MENEKRLEQGMEDPNNNSEPTIITTKSTASTATADFADNGDNIYNNNSNNNTPLGGRWEELHGNYILRPQYQYSSPTTTSLNGSNSQQQQPRALIHFLGGALLGAAPQLTYRYLLERLSSRGYLIVATPYQLSFDHLATCDEIIERFELVAPDLARREYIIVHVCISYCTCQGWNNIMSCAVSELVDILGSGGNNNMCGMVDGRL